MGGGNAEERQHLVPDELVDDSPVRLADADRLRLDAAPGAKPSQRHVRTSLVGSRRATMVLPEPSGPIISR